jgi:hypothetical protein
VKRSMNHWLGSQTPDSRQFWQVFRWYTQLRKPQESVQFPVALTIATMPARTASGRLSQRFTNSAKSGDFRAKSAKQDAKFSSGLTEVFDKPGDTDGLLRFAKPVSG